MNEIIEHNYPQGSPAWLRDRLGKNNASEAAAALACSDYITRDQLLYAYFTGTAVEVTPEQQALFDRGHETERKARPIAEAWLQRSLFPVVLSRRWPGIKRPLGASYDGLIEPARKAGFECKMLNAALRQALPASGWTGVNDNDARLLPKMYRVQMEQQTMVAGSLERVLFMACEFEGDKLVDARLCWYFSDPQLREEIVNGWVQFEADLAVYVVPDVKPPPPVGNKVAGTLPALIVEVRGEVLASNLKEWEAAAMAKVGSVISVADLKTDQDFADAKEAVKWCDDAAGELALAKKLALAKMATVADLFAAIDRVVDQLDQKRIALEKGVAARRDARVKEIVDSGIARLTEHVKACEQRLVDLLPTDMPRWHGELMPRVQPDFWGAVRGKRSFGTMESAVNDELARRKVEANVASTLRETNIREITTRAPKTLHLFADWQSLITKDAELVTMQVDARLKAERDRLAEVARVAALPAAPASAPAPAPAFVATAAAAAAAAPVPNGLPEPRYESRVERITGDDPFSGPAPGTGQLLQGQPTPGLSKEPTLKAGDIADRLGFALTIDFIVKTLHQQPTADGTRKLFSEAQFEAICFRLQEHVETARLAARQAVNDTGKRQAATQAQPPAAERERAPVRQAGTIALQPIQSSMLSAAGYDPKNSTLAVQFPNGNTYHYAGVPPKVAADFVGAESPGRFYAANIKGKYEATKIT